MSELRKLIEKTLSLFRLGQTVDEDGEHTIQLSDALSCPEDGSIATGLREVEDLATNLELAIVPILAALRDDAKEGSND